MIDASSTAQLPLVPAQEPLAERRVPHRFTPENARLMAAKSLEARRRNTSERIQLLEQAAIAVAKATDSGLYPVERLARVRLQLDRLDRMAMEEKDPQKLDRLASAQARLAEQERQLAGRPLPGSLRPNSKAKRPNSPLSQPAFADPGQAETPPESPSPTQQVDNQNGSDVSTS